MMPEKQKTTASSDILDAALEYLDKGFSVIPVRRKDKRPHVKWEQFQKRHATREEVESWWDKWPDANVAIVCGEISGIFCVDADGPEGQKWIEERLPRTGVYSITARGVHALYRTPQNSVIRNRVRLSTEVDIRGEGGYFVAPPSIHESGHQYEWRFIMDGWDDLGEYAPADPHQIGNLNVSLDGIGTSPSLQPVSKGGRNQSLAQLAGRWVGKGLDLEEVLLLARSWNSTNTPPMGSTELERTVKSIWQTHCKNHGGPVPEIEVDEYDSDIEGEIPEEPGPEYGFLRPGGMLSSLMACFKNNSAASHDLFDLAGAIALLGTVAGHKVMTSSRLRTNFYCVSVGYSGTGKNAPHHIIPNILTRTSAHETLGANEITSHSAILKSLQKKPVNLMLIDEIGYAITALKNPNNPASQAPRLLTDLFTKTDAPYCKTYAFNDDINIPYHHLSVYGTSTPQRFWEGLTLNDAMDGFLARMLIFHSEHEAMMPETSMEYSIPDGIISFIDELYSMQTAMEGPNLMQRPVPFVIRHTKKSESFMKDWGGKHHDIANKSRKNNDGVSSFHHRASEHALKLSLLHSVSIHGTKVIREQIDLPSVEWATELVDWVVGNSIEQIARNISVNELDSIRQKIMNLVEENKRKQANRPDKVKRIGVTEREIYQRIRGLDDWKFDRAVTGLMKAGYLEKTTLKTRNHKEFFVYLLPLTA